jgi:drug/metabolite transporter (DMT)-like permease
MNRGYPLILSASVIYGLSNVFIKILSADGISVFEISLVSQAVIAAILVPFVRNELRQLTHSTSRFFLQYGAISSVLVVTFVGSIAYNSSLGLAIVLFYTQSIWVMLFAKVILNEKITKTKVFASLLSIVGVVFLVNVFAFESISNVGVILGLTSGLTLSLWIIWGKRSRNYNFSPFFTDFATRGFTALWLLLAFPFFSMLIKIKGVSDLSYGIGWTPLGLLVSLGAVLVIPDILFYSGLKVMNASVASVMLLLEPVTTIAVAIAFFNETLTPTLVVGAALILVANYLLVRGEGTNSGLEKPNVEDRTEPKFGA